MTKVTDEKMTKAARNAKHVSIKATDLRGLQFVARSQSNPNEVYHVRLALVNGERMWECDCYGYERFQYCKHCVAAVILVLGIKESRRIAAERAAEKLAATTAGVVASESEPTSVLAASTTDESDAESREDGAAPDSPDSVDEVAPQRVTICSICGEETTLENCIQHPTAPDKETTLDELIEQQRDREAKRDLFRRMLDERLEPAQPKTLREEIEDAVLIRPEPRGVRFGSMHV